MLQPTVTLMYLRIQLILPRTDTLPYREVRMSNFFATWFTVEQSLVLHEVRLILIQYEFKACMLLTSF